LKKKIVWIILFALLISVFSIPKLYTAYADEEKKEEEKSMSDALDETFNSFDLSALENFLDQMEQEYSKSLGTTIKELFYGIVNGENTYDFNYFLNIILSIFLGEFRNILPTAISIIIIGVLYGILKNFTDNITSTGIRKIVYIACYGVMLALIMLLVSNCIIKTKNTINMLGSFIDIVFPILLTLITSLGGTATVAIYQPLILILITVIFKIIEVVIFPLFYASLVFGLISEMTDNVKLGKFTKTSKSAANWILGIMFSIFITFTTAQGITGASFDSLATRGAKYALSSYVPVIGNYLKEGFDLVLASCIVIKNALGLSAIIVLIFLAIIPIIKILTLIFTFKILSAIMEPISDKKFANMLYSTSNALTLLVTIVICITFTLLIMFMLIIYTCNWGVL
jgi:stage III sporulation protein AE